MISIRFATGEDAELIADMSRQTFYDTFASQNSVEDMSKFLNEQFTREALIKEVSTKDNIFLLAYDQEEPVGYARLRENNNPPSLGSTNAIELARIYATSNSIGKGVGKALMEKCIGLAEKGKKDVIWLGVWEKNQRAIDFYTKWGFEKFADHDFVLGNDVQKDWLMKKKIQL
ncbi:GNAT family N-acetyltransferase [Terrimonas alba]|uniref:GNAT family N-acetyltransferase n=1 Tax=Terrimonas alba TaxID=3349636 RepID=UPI0035F246A8